MSVPNIFFNDSEHYLKKVTYITLNGTNGDALSILYIGNVGLMYNGTVIKEDEVFFSPCFETEDVVTLPRLGDIPPPLSFNDLSIMVFPMLPMYIIITLPSVSGNSTSRPLISFVGEWLGCKTYG